ncbi:hypothetical protein MN608_10579 [Microdochium nivale]|nr:hypothetical protein MN608_10579 [Microdochium nivale]
MEHELSPRPTQPSILIREYWDDSAECFKSDKKEIPPFNIASEKGHPQILSATTSLLGNDQRSELRSGSVHPVLDLQARLRPRSRLGCDRNRHARSTRIWSGTARNSSTA